MLWTSSTVLRDRLLAAPEAMYVGIAGHWMAAAMAGPSQDYLQDPGLTGDPLIDALVAASAERVALLRGDPAPSWLSGPGRALPTTWHPGPTGLLSWSLAHAPASFSVRGLLVEEDSLQTV